MADKLTLTKKEPEPVKTPEPAKSAEPVQITTVKTTLADDLHAAVVAAESLDAHAALSALENLMGEMSVKLDAFGHHLSEELRARFKSIF